MSKSYFREARKLREDGSVMEIVSLYREAIKNNPNFAHYYYQLGRTLVEFGVNVTEAENAYRKAIDLQTGNCWFCFELGVLLTNQGSFDEAFEWLTKAINIKPEFYLFYNQMGEIRLKQGLLNESAHYFLKSIEINPKSSFAYAKLASVFWKQKKLDDAVKLYQTAILLDHYSHNLHYQLGCLFLEKSQLNEAVTAIKKAIKIQPKICGYYHKLGLIYQRQKNSIEAECAFRNALEVTPTFWHSHAELANTLKAQGKIDEALEAYQRTIQLQPNAFYPRVHLGEILEKKGQIEDAFVHFSRAIEISPEMSRKLNLIDKVEKNCGRVIFSLRQSLVANPHDYYAHQNLGELLEKNNQLEEAVIYYQKAIDLRPENATAYASMGRVLDKQKKADEAICFLRKYITLVDAESYDYIEKCHTAAQTNQDQQTLNYVGKNQVKRLIVSGAPTWTLNVLSILHFQRTTREYTECEDYFLFLSNGDRLSQTMEMISIWPFEKIIPGFGCADLFNRYDISLETKKKLLKNYLKRDFDVIYVHTNYHNVFKECLQAYPDARKIVYGDSLGLLVLSGEVPVDDAYLITPSTQIDSNFQKCHLTLVDPEYYRLSISRISEKMKNLSDYCVSVNQKLGSNLTLVLTSYLSKTHMFKQRDIEAEVNYCLETVLPNTNKGESVLVKGHPGGLGLEISSRLSQELMKHDRNVIEVDRKFSQIPIDLFLPCLKLNKAITLNSSGCLPIAFMKKDALIILGVSDETRKKYIVESLQERSYLYDNMYYLQVLQIYQNEISPISLNQIKRHLDKFPEFPAYLTRTMLDLDIYETQSNKV